MIMVLKLKQKWWVNGAITDMSPHLGATHDLTIFKSRVSSYKKLLNKSEQNLEIEKILQGRPRTLDTHSQHLLYG